MTFSRRMAMRGTWLVAPLWILAALLVLLGPGCAVNPDPGGFDLCKVAKAAADVACAQGYSTRCTQAADAYDALGCGKYQRPERPDPCKGKAPICERNDDTECWAVTPDWLCTWFPKPDPVCPTCPAGYSRTDPAKGCVKDPVVPPPPSPPPPPAAGLLDDEQLHAKPGDTGNQTWARVWAALEADKAAHPDKYRGDGACLVDKAAGIDPTYDRLAARLGDGSAASITDDGVRSDCIFVRRGTSQEYDEVHLFEYGGGCHGTGPGAIKGVYVYGAAPPPPPGPTELPAPVPPRAYEDGKLRLKIQAHPHGRWVDSTPVFLDTWDPATSSCPYCTAIGLGEYGGLPRCTCPGRPDGHPDRVTIEDYLLGTPQGRHGPRWQCQGTGQPVLNEDNPFQAASPGPACGAIRACTWGLEVCSAWV